MTRDVDAVFKPHGIVLEEARKVADDLGLPYWWLNEQASVYISGKEDASKRRVFDHPGLRVMAAQGNSKIANGSRLITMSNRDPGGPIYGGNRHCPLN